MIGITPNFQFQEFILEVYFLVSKFAISPER